MLANFEILGSDEQTWDLVCKGWWNIALSPTYSGRENANLHPYSGKPGVTDNLLADDCKFSSKRCTEIG